MIGINDLKLYSRFELHKKNTTTIGHIFFPENQLDFDKKSPEAETYLAGEKEFKVKDFEVFQIEYDLK